MIPQPSLTHISQPDDPMAPTNQHSIDRMNISLQQTLPPFSTPLQSRQDPLFENRLLFPCQFSMDDVIEMVAPLDTPSRLAPPFSPIIKRPPSPSKPLPPPPANMTNEALQQLIKGLSHLGQQPPSQPSSIPLTQQTGIHPPDTFDSSNPNNLQPFLLQCQLMFNLYPQQFSTE